VTDINILDFVHKSSEAQGRETRGTCPPSEIATLNFSLNSMEFVTFNQIFSIIFGFLLIGNVYVVQKNWIIRWPWLTFKSHFHYTAFSTADILQHILPTKLKGYKLCLSVYT